MGLAVSLTYFYRKYLKTLSVFFLALLIVGCLPEEKDDDDDNESNKISALNGFWKGGFEQTDTLRVLIYNGSVYALDKEKALFGSVTSPSDEEVDFSLTAYPFAYEDEPNFEFVSDRTATNYTVNGLLATTSLIVGDYETSSREFGSLELTNDGTFTNPSSLASLTGKWTTTDLELNITSRGRFLGVNNGTNKNCSFEGQIQLINTAQSLLSMTLNRRNCDDFNGESTGFVAINSDGALELYSKMGNQLLFMKFSAPASSSGTDTTGNETGSGTEEETTTGDGTSEEPAAEGTT